MALEITEFQNQVAHEAALEESMASPQPRVIGAVTGPRHTATSGYSITLKG